MDPSLRWDDSDRFLPEFTLYLTQGRHDSFSLLTSCATAPAKGKLILRFLLSNFKILT